MSGLAALGHTIVATLHQPRAAIWALLHQAPPWLGLPRERSRREQRLPMQHPPPSAWRPMRGGARRADSTEAVANLSRARSAQVVVLSALEQAGGRKAHNTVQNSATLNPLCLGALLEVIRAFKARRRRVCMCRQRARFGDPKQDCRRA
jgi:hypothetical protein